jgi:hypothetical protein
MQRAAGVLVVLGALGFGYWWGQSLKPVDMIRAQLHAIDEGEYPQAYDYLSSTAKAKLSFNEFVALIQNNSVVAETRNSIFLSRSMNGATATIGGILEGYGLDVSDALYIVVKEGDQWRIESFEWGPPRR